MIQVSVSCCCTVELVESLGGKNQGCRTVRQGITLPRSLQYYIKFSIFVYGVYVSVYVCSYGWRPEVVGCLPLLLSTLYTRQGLSTVWSV